MNNLFKNIASFSIMVLAPFGASTQLNILDQFALGGNGNSIISNQGVENSNDGGFYTIISTTSSTGSGNMTELSYGSQYVVLTKLSSTFQIEWQASFGGLQPEGTARVLEVSDGIILAVNSLSGVSGNKTVINYGATDGWLIKLDFDGEILWQKGYGGSDHDNIVFIIESNNGDLLLGFNSSSGSSGNRTAPLKGVNDYWLVKTDSSGEILWDRSYGSNGEERLHGLLELSNGNIILTGHSVDGTISFDKTENQYSFMDAWVVAADLDGNYLWDKTIGGSGFEGGGYSIAIDDTIFVLISSSSNQSGLRNEPLKGSRDIWLSKLDLNGEIISSFFYGGNGYDMVTGVGVYDQDKIVVSSYSDSDMSYDKTENSKGGQDYWVFMLDKDLIIRGEKTIGGQDADAMSCVISRGNKILLAGNSFSDVSGDKTIPKFNTDPNFFDAWLVELDASTLEIIQSSSISPKVYPNPVTDYLTINLSEFASVSKVDIFDYQGKLLLSRDLSNTPNPTTLQLDMTAFSSGMYTVRVHGDNVVRAVKVVK